MRKYFILAAAALAMVACSNEENENSLVQNGDVIRLTASVGNAAQTRAGYDVQSTAFVADRSINVECTPVGGSLVSKVYTTAAASEGVNALTIPENPFYWPANGANVTLKAYHPSTVESTTTSFSVLENQSTDANYMDSDLMYSNEVTGTNTKPYAPQGFTFTHALTKIVVKLVPGAGMTAADLAAATITLHAKKTATIAAGVVSAASGDVATITMGTGSDNTNGIAAIIVPQTISAQDFITVTSGNNSVTYQLAAEKEFAAGTVYTYTLTVSMTEINLQSTTITNWTPGDGDSGNVTI